MCAVDVNIMNTLEISKCLKAIHPTLTSNVFAANRLPVHMSTPVYLISNLDPDTKPGSHWIAIYIGTNGIGEYFDTFGRKPNSYHLSFLKRNTSRWIYSNKIIQNVFSSFCGEYCLVYIYLKRRGMSLTNFVEMFNQDTNNNNDLLLNDMFKSFIIF